MRFEFATANQIIFGEGAAVEVGSHAARLGAHALVCLGIPEQNAATLLDSLKRSRVKVTLYAVNGEPTVESVAEGAALARRQGCDAVIGLGGGSAMDMAKATAALTANEGEATDYLEVIGKGQALRQAPLPVIAIPTTAGTGAEVTRNAVIGSPAHGVKVSLRSPLILPRLALVDPTLTYGLPPAITASTGLDALTQVIEPFVSVKANPLTDAFCREGMQRARRALRLAYTQDDPAARRDMALTSLLGGLALANAGLGVAHGFAGVLGGMLGAPHGALCAALLPSVMAANAAALQARQPESEALRRYEEVARLLAGEGAKIEEGIAWVSALCAALNIPPLRTYGLSEANLAEAVEKALKASSSKGNPIVLSQEEMEKILTLAMG